MGGSWGWLGRLVHLRWAGQEVESCCECSHLAQFTPVRSGMELLNDPWFNKGSAFPKQERDRLGLRGLLPPGRLTLDKQVTAEADDNHLPHTWPIGIPLFLAFNML